MGAAGVGTSSSNARAVGTPCLCFPAGARGGSLGQVFGFYLVSSPGFVFLSAARVPLCSSTFGILTRRVRRKPFLQAYEEMCRFLTCCSFPQMRCRHRCEFSVAVQKYLKGFYQTIMIIAGVLRWGYLGNPKRNTRSIFLYFLLCLIDLLLAYKIPSVP